MQRLVSKFLSPIARRRCCTCMCRTTATCSRASWRGRAPGASATCTCPAAPRRLAPPQPPSAPCSPTAGASFGSPAGLVFRRSASVLSSKAGGHQHAGVPWCVRRQAAGPWPNLAAPETAPAVVGRNIRARTAANDRQVQATERLAREPLHASVLGLFMLKMPGAGRGSPVRTHSRVWAAAAAAAGRAPRPSAWLWSWWRRCAAPTAASSCWPTGWGASGWVQPLSA